MGIKLNKDVYNILTADGSNCAVYNQEGLWIILKLLPRRSVAFEMGRDTIDYHYQSPNLWTFKEPRNRQSWLYPSSQGLRIWLLGSLKVYKFGLRLLEIHASMMENDLWLWGKVRDQMICPGNYGVRWQSVLDWCVPEPSPGGIMLPCMIRPMDEWSLDNVFLPWWF
jgi:hypothetical protein